MAKKKVAAKSAKAKHNGLLVRDRALEETRSQLGLFHDARDIRDAREEGTMDELWMVAQSLMLCGLPYDEVDDTQWERQARLADGSTLRVTFAANTKGVPLPFGQDRGPLYFMIDRAIAKHRRLLSEVDARPDLSRTLPDSMLTWSDEDKKRELARRERERQDILDQARFVEWTTASEYLNAMGKARGGRDYTVLKERMKRIRSCSISIIRQTPKGNSESLLLPMIRSTRMPDWITDGEDQATSLSAPGAGEPIGIEIGHDFFRDFTRNHLPVPALIITKLIRRPKTLDLVIWLCWRVYAAKKDSFIPIEDLKNQLGSTDTNDGRVLADLRKAIEFLHQAGWWQLRARVLVESRSRGKSISRAGLQIGPPTNLVYFNMPGSVEKLIEADDPLDGDL
jgi:hypothetical protein